MSDETPLILGDAVAAELNRPPRRRWLRGKKNPPPPLTHCENCGRALDGPYCAQCGQPAIDYRRSIGSLLVDAADAFFNLDARFFQSFGLLLIKPWQLTNEFVEGKRARHVHPLRVYLIASVLFFLVINFLSRGSHLEAQRDEDGSVVSLERTRRRRPRPGLGVRTPLPIRRSVSLGISPEPRTRPNRMLPGTRAAPQSKREHKVFFEELDKQKDVPPFMKWVEAHAKEKLGPTGDRGDLFLKALLQNLAPMVLCCIPLFALVLKILYIFKRRFYVDHLIFALHTHAFIFLSTVLIIGLGFLCAMQSAALTAVGLHSAWSNGARAAAPRDPAGLSTELAGHALQVRPRQRDLFSRCSSWRSASPRSSRSFCPNEGIRRETSADRADHAAVSPHRCAIDRGGERAADERDHIGNLFRLQKSLHDRARPRVGEEFFLKFFVAHFFLSARADPQTRSRLPTRSAREGQS